MIKDFLSLLKTSSGGTSYSNSLFSKELEALKLATDQSFGLSPKEYFPHISLYYGSALQSQKEECSRSLLPPTSVLLNKISLVKIHEDIDEWDIVQTFSL